MASHSQVGYLIPLRPNLEEDTAAPKLPLSSGSNAIGRHNLPFSDKRLSRNHISLSLSSDSSSATLFVEGTNPIVVKSGNERKKVRHGEKVSVSNGDIVELIPGHHFYKYVALNSSDDSPSSPCKTGIKRDGRDLVESKQLSSKKSKVQKSNGEAENCRESVRNFYVTKDAMPSTFRLLRVQGLPAWANTSCVSITDVIEGDILVAILSNYMVDMDWLLSACPILAKIPHVMVVHGEGDGTLEHMKKSKPTNWILHKPPLPISFGTHHSKAMILVYRRGVRIIVHTANLIYVDWNNKSQGLWMQDFPWKDEKGSKKGCPFENDLIDYLGALKWPEFLVKLPDLGSFNINPYFFKKFDYDGARVRLIASVPGYHTGANLKKWGHMKLRSVLQECTFDKDFEKAPLVYQFSSLGSLDEKWMTELATSLSSGFSEDKKPLGLGEPLIIWPTVEDVRCSLEGYAAGNAIPSPLKNVEKPFLKKYWAKWKASHSGRCRAMPHIKTFSRYNGQTIVWSLLTSANLSKAAWGALQKNNSQLMVRSYELGVLFLPSLIKKPHSVFSCTSNVVPTEDKHVSGAPSNLKTKLVTLDWQGTVDSSTEVIRMPLPYELPPQRYSSEDVPWSWDRRYSKKDVYGQVWPRSVQLYTSQD